MTHTADLGDFHVTRKGLTINLALVDGQDPTFRFTMPPTAGDLRIMLLGHASVADQAPLMCNYDVQRRQNPGGVKAPTLTLRCKGPDGEPFDLRSGRLVIFSLRPANVGIEVDWEGAPDAFRILDLSDEM